MNNGNPNNFFTNPTFSEEKQETNHQTKKFFNVPSNSNAPEEVSSQKKFSLVNIISIIIGVIGVFALIFIVISVLNTSNEEENQTQSDDPVDSSVKETTTAEPVPDQTISVGIVSFTYNGTWTKANESTDSYAITKNDAKVILLRTTNESRYTTSEFTSELVTTYQSNPLEYSEVSVDNIVLNDLTWSIIKVTSTTSKIIQLIYADSYDIYSLSYSIDIDKTINSEDFQKIYETLTVDTSEEQNSHEEAINFLTGEWEWGIYGYLVFQDDVLYIYKDETKSMDNVLYGTYVADSNISEYVKDATSGYYVSCSYDRYIVGGEVQDLTGQPGVELAFIPNEDGTYYVYNINTNVGETAKKVK